MTEEKHKLTELEILSLKGIRCPNCNFLLLGFETPNTKYLTELEVDDYLYAPPWFVKRTKVDGIFISLGSGYGYVSRYGTSCLLVEKIEDGVVLTCQDKDCDRWLLESLCEKSPTISSDPDSLLVKKINWFDKRYENRHLLQ